MTYGCGKSDSTTLAEKLTNKAEHSLRSRWREGWRPKGIRVSKACTLPRTGKACRRR
jgi:hypothetical protein